MSDETDALRDLYLDITDETVLTESQHEQPSHEPIDDDTSERDHTVAAVTDHAGLTDAVEGAETSDQ